jgi:hypothetical protein
VYCLAVAVATAVEALDIEMKNTCVRVKEATTANGSVKCYTLHSLL